MSDPYQLLGVSKSASPAEIKSAYRKLAKKLHPDVNPGRKDIEQKFKEVTAAYDLLSDPERRARYDRGEIDASGNERGFAHAGGGPFGNGRRGYSQRASGGAGDPFGGLGVDDFFAEFFGSKRGGGVPRGSDVTYALTVPFVDACLGGKQRVTLANRKTIDVNIPPGTEEGHKLRLRGLGAAGRGEAGDAIVEIHVAPHAYFVRKDFDIHLEAPISLSEAVLGANINVPTLGGEVVLKVPKGANTDTTLRLKGKGVPRAQGPAGDMFVKLKVVMPDSPSGDLADFIEKWARKNAYNPRKKLGW